MIPVLSCEKNNNFDLSCKNYTFTGRVYLSDIEKDSSICKEFSNKTSRSRLKVPTSL